MGVVAVGVPGAADPAGGRGIEVRAEDQHVALGVTLKERVPGGAASRSSAGRASGMAHWIGLCIRSPLITASDPSDDSRTQTWPGVCPWLGSSQSESLTR